MHDSGVGLTRDEAQELLATIGRSSKRDVELGTGREEFLGQFGIGLLSAFMVADEIELVSRSARRTAAGGAPVPVRWRGRADGRYELVELAPDDPAAPAEPGSVVRLHPRRDTEHWLAPESVVALAQDFGSLLPVELLVETRLDGGPGEDRDGGAGEDHDGGAGGDAPVAVRRLSGRTCRGALRTRRPRPATPRSPATPSARSASPRSHRSTSTCRSPA